MLAAAGLALVLPQVTAAAERPASWDMSEDELRAIGLGQSRGMPVLPDPALVGEVEPRQAMMAVIFVNFDAITLEMGGDDSHNDISSIFAGDFEAYGGGATERAALMEAVRIDWAAYNVLIVDERPTSGDYTMNVTSPTNPAGPGVLGIAPLDCNDAAPNNVTFAFHGADDGFSPATQATTVGQEVAHSYGLEHVDEPADIMNPSNAGGDPSFMDECLPVVAGGTCGQQHAEECDDEQTQNSHRELLTLFGPKIVDTEPPTVRIVSPADRAELEPGTDFSIEVEALDDNTVLQVQLFNKGAPLQTDVTGPYGWQVNAIPAGTYEFTVVATDIGENTSESDVVTVFVGVEPSVDTGGAEESGSEDGTGSDTAGQDGGGDDKGCGCGQPAGSGATLLGLTVLLGIRRRRARTRA